MTNVFRAVFAVILTLTITITNGTVVTKPWGDNDFSFPEEHFVPSNLRIAEVFYDKLLSRLADELSATVNIKADGYFPKDVESDESDQLELLQEYAIDEDDVDSFDEPIAKFKINLPNDASVSTGFGNRELTYSKVLVVSKNGTKTYSKVHQSLKVGGGASTSVTGNYNTSLDVTTSALAKFAVNVTYSSKGHHVKTVANGKVLVSSLSKSKIAKKRLLQEAFVDYSTLVNAIELNGQVVVNSSICSETETFKLPFRSYFTLFRAGLNTTTVNAIKTRAVLAGEILSRVAFANKTISLTKSCIKAFVKSKSTVPTNNDEDDLNFEERLFDTVEDDDASTTASPDIYEISAQNKSRVVIDVISCTKTRVYGKSVQKGVFAVLAGSGQMSWEKSQITIDAKRLQNLLPHEYGVHFINKQLESSSLIKLEKFNNNNQLKMTMSEN